MSGLESHTRKIGVIGTGAWGANLVKELKDVGVLGGIADPDAANRDRAAEIAPDVELFTSASDLLAGGFDAVAIATPAQTHYELARDALASGLDVFVEKPMTLDAAEASELHRLAVDGGLVLMVGHLLLYEPAIRFIAEYLRAEKLGQVLTFHQRRSKLGRVRQHENVLWSFGTHDIAVLLNLEPTPVRSISVSGHTASTRSVEDDVYLHITFESGAKANLHNSWLWPRTERELIIVGDAGILVYEETRRRVVLHNKTVSSSLATRDDGEQVVFEGGGSPLRIELEHFIDCCQERRQPISDGESGVRVIEVLQRAEELLKADPQR